MKNIEHIAPSSILIVDDHPDNLYLLEMILHAKNYRTVTAKNGLEAIAAVKTHEVDLILMDVMMPEMDGFEASRHIRNMKISEHIPIILLTAKKKDTEDVVRGLGEGAVEYITKPFDEAELLARINAMLRIKHLHDDNRKLLDKVLNQQKLMDMELKMAAHVQKAMLPSPERFRDCTRCAIDTYYQATASIGGDFYDYLDYGNNRCAFMIADVSGHGPAAALIVAIVKTLLANESIGQPSPSILLNTLNDKLTPMIPDDQFVTMFFCIVDYNTNTITYANAGHPAPYMFAERRDEVVELSTPGMVVGMFESQEYPEKTVAFEKGDKFILYSDGLFETTGENHDLFGQQRMKEYIAARTHLPGKEVAEGLMSEIDRYWDGQSSRDDIAVVVLEFK